MSVIFVPGNPPSYQCLSTDLNGSGSVVGISYIGAEVVVSDTNDVYRVNSDKTLSKVPQQVIQAPELSSTASNLMLVLSGSKGSAAIANGTTILDLYTTGSTVRAGWSTLAILSGCSSGSAAVAGDFKSGYLLPQNSWKKLVVGKGVSRTLYFQSGSPTDTVYINQS